MSRRREGGGALLVVPLVTAHRHPAVELGRSRLVNRAPGVGGNAVQDLPVLRGDLNEDALAVLKSVRALDFDLPVAGLCAFQGMGAAVPAVEITEQMHGGGVGRVLPEYPAGVCAVQAVIHVAVGEGEYVLVAQQPLPGLFAVVDALFDPVRVGREIGIDGEYAGMRVF